MIILKGVIILKLFYNLIFFSPETGQLETVGNGFQLNNKLLERALIDYLESIPQQVFVFSSSLGW